MDFLWILHVFLLLPKQPAFLKRKWDTVSACTVWMSLPVNSNEGRNRQMVNTWTFLITTLSSWNCLSQKPNYSQEVQIHETFYWWHYIDVIMTTMASQITSLTVVYSTVYSDADQRKLQSPSSLAFVWGIHRDRWFPRTKGQLRGKCFHLMTSSWTPYVERRWILKRTMFSLDRISP